VIIPIDEVETKPPKPNGQRRCQEP
jgi:hypothetical protein